MIKSLELNYNKTISGLIFVKGYLECPTKWIKREYAIIHYNEIFKDITYYYEEKA